jgi:Ras-related protein Rab-11A
MLVYDITRRQTFEHIPLWLEELRKHTDSNIIVMLIGNKSDLESRRAVETEDAKEYAEKEKLFLLETSALNTSNVENAFLKVLDDIYTIGSVKSLTSNQGRATAAATTTTASTSLLSGVKIAVGQVGTTRGCCT